MFQGEITLYMARIPSVLSRKYNSKEDSLLGITDKQDANENI